MKNILSRAWRYAKLLVWFVWLLLLFVLAIHLVLNNPQNMPFNALGYAFDVNIGIFFSSSLFLGFLVGLAVLSLNFIQAKRRVRKLEKKISQFEEELKQLRIAPQ